MNIGTRHWLCMAIITTVVSPLPAEITDVSGLMDAAGLAYRRDVQKELEMIDEQVAAMKRGNKEVSEPLKLLTLEFATASPEEVIEIRKNILTLQRELLEKKASARQEVLLPHQQVRFEQLLWQYRSLNEPLKTFQRAFSLTEQQEEKMSSKVGELRHGLLEEMSTFHNRSQREIVELLTPEQRVEWHAKTGKAFKFRSSSKGLDALRRLK